ncbi:uncharacterized protein PV09_01805 [Verruconis gallopava]|uniref:Uncharacterized protein n=1 Tax=Verruconis gallopava TaxID=253628 RepID=A0A0D2B9H9_9PEZI|nr:uncharacterized protein PV09_01805 [Verruconis gallopava]KIW07894.1 hypothetical protein PV09_01805 [Verruconis gallopava]
MGRGHPNHEAGFFAIGRQELLFPRSFFSAEGSQEGFILTLVNQQPHQKKARPWTIHISITRRLRPAHRQDIFSGGIVASGIMMPKWGREGAAYSTRTAFSSFNCPT